MTDIQVKLLRWLACVLLYAGSQLREEFPKIKPRHERRKQ